MLLGNSFAKVINKPGWFLLSHMAIWSLGKDCDNSIQEIVHAYIVY